LLAPLVQLLQCLVSRVFFFHDLKMGAITRNSRLQWAETIVASLSMKFLKSLPQRTFVAQTPWYKDSVKFTGPLLRDVLAAAKVKGSVIHATALDDYRASIPFSDAQDYDVILAHQMNGETLTPKNKGPLFIVYPYDSKPELQTVRFYERSIWQLKSLQVE